MKIIVIEDEKILAHAMAKNFTSLGYDVVVAYDGELGAAAVNENPDAGLVLLDLMLPKKNGFEVLEEIKGNPDTNQIPVVFLSNIAEEAKIKEGIEKGAVDYIIKSNISIDVLNEAVSKYLRR